jgi:hypothetical protein
MTSIMTIIAAIISAPAAPPMSCAIGSSFHRIIAHFASIDLLLRE